MKTRKSFHIIGAFLSALCILAFACKSSTDNTQQGEKNPTPILVEEITINGGDLTLKKGDTASLTVTVSPDNADNKSVTWNSSRKSVVTVDNSGQITAIALGNAIITAMAKDGSGVCSVGLNVTVMTQQEPGSSMTPQEIFTSLKGQKVTTNGWADQANSGAGLSYANPAALTLIDDASYPIAKDKYQAFINANITNANINNNTGVISGGTVSNDQKFIIISGDIDLSNGRINDIDKSFYDIFNTASPYGRVNGDIVLNIGSNTTIIGINNARIMFGGIRINNRTNVIIRNVIFYDAHGSTENDTSKPGYDQSKASIDALVVQGDSNGVWVDHCKFTDGTCNDMLRNYNHDGSFDIPKGKNITVSWCEFTNHDKVMLVAGSDNDANAVADDRQITLHHNYFHETTQRMPRTRGTQMHVYNNYYNNIGVSGNTGSFMGPGWGAEFIVENNYFSPKSGKTIEWFDTNPSVYPVKFYYNDNNIANSNASWWGRTSDPKPWMPAYQYTPDNNSELPTSIPTQAGPSLKFKK